MILIRNFLLLICVSKSVAHWNISVKSLKFLVLSFVDRFNLNSVFVGMLTSFFI
jgi:hypothetical protein